MIILVDGRLFEWHNLTSVCQELEQYDDGEVSRTDLWSRVPAKLAAAVMARCVEYQIRYGGTFPIDCEDLDDADMVVNDWNAWHRAVPLEINICDVDRSVIVRWCERVSGDYGDFVLTADAAAPVNGWTLITVEVR